MARKCTFSTATSLQWSSCILNSLKEQKGDYGFKDMHQGSTEHKFDKNNRKNIREFKIKWMANLCINTHYFPLQMYLLHSIFSSLYYNSEIFFQLLYINLWNYEKTLSFSCQPLKRTVLNTNLSHYRSEAKRVHLT